MNQNLFKLIKTGVFALFIALIYAFSYERKPINVDLIHAIEAKKISAEFVSNGKHSGNSVQYTLTNLTSSSLSLKIPAGIKYSTPDPGEQTLIQLEDKIIVLKPKETLKGQSAAFCMQSNKRSPSMSLPMSTEMNNNPDLTKLTNYIRGKKLDKSTYQDAVWAISNGHSVSNIASEDSATKEFRKQVATISGQKDTWFTSLQNVTIDEQGNFNMETVNISGRLEFTVEKGSYVHQDLHKANGDLIYASDKAMQVRTGNVGYTFRIQVKGWEKGEYYIRLHDGNNEIKRYRFTV